MGISCPIVDPVDIEREIGPHSGDIYTGLPWEKDCRVDRGVEESIKSHDRIGMRDVRLALLVQRHVVPPAHVEERARSVDPEAETPAPVESLGELVTRPEAEETLEPHIKPQRMLPELHGYSAAHARKEQVRILGTEQVGPVFQPGVTIGDPPEREITPRFRSRGRIRLGKPDVLQPEAQLSAALDGDRAHPGYAA